MILNEFLIYKFGFKERGNIIIYMITGIVNEEWRSVSGCLNYQVSNVGGPLNSNTGRIMKPSVSTDGYYHISLCNDKSRKHYWMNRLVA